QPSVAYQSTVWGTYGGPTESPFVIRAGEGWILFVCESTQYDRTLAYFSSDPLHFEDSGRIDINLNEHCTERSADPDSGTTWITGGGGDRGGLTSDVLQLAAPYSSPHPDPGPGTGVLPGVRDAPSPARWTTRSSASWHHIAGWPCPSRRAPSRPVAAGVI